MELEVGLLVRHIQLYREVLVSVGEGKPLWEWAWESSTSEQRIPFCHSNQVRLHCCLHPAKPEQEPQQLVILLLCCFPPSLFSSRISIHSPGCHSFSHEFLLPLLPLSLEVPLNIHHIFAHRLAPESVKLEDLPPPPLSLYSSTPCSYHIFQGREPCPEHEPWCCMYIS